MWWCTKTDKYQVWEYEQICTSLKAVKQQANERRTAVHFKISTGAQLFSCFPSDINHKAVWDMTCQQRVWCDGVLCTFHNFNFNHFYDFGLEGMEGLRWSQFPGIVGKTYEEAQTGIWSKLGKRKHYSCCNMLKKENPGSMLVLNLLAKVFKACFTKNQQGKLFKL